VNIFDQLSLIWEFPSSRNQVKMQRYAWELSQSGKSGYDFIYCEPLISTMERLYDNRLAFAPDRIPRIKQCH
jgi:hypothetical protein